MPYRMESVPPDLFLEHGGLKVYCTYKYGDIDQGPQTHEFSLDENCGVDECVCREHPCRSLFDVRELNNWSEPPHPPFLTGSNTTQENSKAWDAYYENAVEEKHIKSVIREAIDRGLLKATGS